MHWCEVELGGALLLACDRRVKFREPQLRIFLQDWKTSCVDMLISGGGFSSKPGWIDIDLLRWFLTIAEIGGRRPSEARKPVGGVQPQRLALPEHARLPR